MKFKIGDLVKCNSGGVNIWVKENNIYQVLDIVIKPKTSADPCYRNCDHPMHHEKPEQYFLKVVGELGECMILESCFSPV